MLRRILLSLTVLGIMGTPIAVTATAHAATGPQRQAIGAAHDYLRYEAFSKQGLIDQLDSRYGDGYSKAVATYAVNHISVSWNYQAARSAKQYLRFEHFSCSGLIEQLHSPYGEKFTYPQAVYGAHHTSAC
jgi:hypothetical protein